MTAFANYELPQPVEIGKSPKQFEPGEAMQPGVSGVAAWPIRDHASSMPDKLRSPATRKGSMPNK